MPSNAMQEIYTVKVAFHQHILRMGDTPGSGKCALLTTM